MTRQPHDQFAKQYLEELLSLLGTVEISKEVTDETRQVDVFFSPNSNSFDAKLELENWAEGIYFLSPFFVKINNLL